MDRIVFVVCIQREGDPSSEQFVFVAMDLEGSIHRSPLLVENEIRRELGDLGLTDGAVDRHIHKVRAFKTTTTNTPSPGGLRQ